MYTLSELKQLADDLTALADDLTALGVYATAALVQRAIGHFSR
jgi:hypothetical protein